MNAPNSLHDPKAFKFFALQEKKAMSLLREVVWRWRRSSAYVPGKAGNWAAYPLETWQDWMGGIPRRTLDRCLKTLHVNGLIERERHRFAGNNICTFLRPSELALKYVGKEGDLDALTGSKTAKKKQAVGAPLGAADGVPLGATHGVTDHTTFPFHSTNSSIQKKAPASATTGGKGKAGEKVKKKLILKSVPKKEKTLQPATTEPDDVDALIAEFGAKKLAKRLKQFPILEGAHAKHVKHPYEMHGSKWLGWSAKLQKDRYAVYVQMVENWYQGKKGKPYKPLSYDDAEFDLDLDSIPDFEEALFKK